MRRAQGAGRSQHKNVECKIRCHCEAVVHAEAISGLWDLRSEILGSFLTGMKGMKGMDPGFCKSGDYHHRGHRGHGENLILGERTVPVKAVKAG